MTPREWNHVLNHKVEWTIAYPAVERVVKAHLADVAYPGVGTSDLVEELYPEASATGDGIYTRRRIFAALTALAEHELADWCHQEDKTRARFGKMISRRRWHSPQADTEVQEVQTPTPTPAEPRPLAQVLLEETFKAGYLAGGGPLGSWQTAWTVWLTSHQSQAAA